ncbi:MAG: 5-methyltetrahydropteroyltriglutamate--homocysteine S-methyltransferase [Alphaproteobacteria bacterium]|nr:5-methyltetrahydropteroyltriglutamate--homocysteine S-methyltransferase [Alphaproteobacteria bacterium]
MAARHPPFRADHVGSLLRPDDLVRAREAFGRGEMDRDALARIEDRAIDGVIRLQEEIGLETVTDGEFRRRNYYGGFYVDGLGGVRPGIEASTSWFYTNAAGERKGAALPEIFDRMRWTKPVHVEDYRYVAQRTDRTVKITLPGPCILHFLAGRENIDLGAYPDLDLFWDDMVHALRSEIAALYEAGCRYVQLDETAFAKFGDPMIVQALKDRGDDWQDLATLYLEVLNRTLEGRPDDLCICVHMCRGNSRGFWQASGGYEPVAEALFNELDVDGFFLEYDSPRAGDFSPLAAMPAGKMVVLGLVSTKSGALEDADDLRRRIEEAAGVLDLDQLCISPQCGFASEHHGNPLTVDQEVAKLRLLAGLAKEIWG